jgi:hypothetical protein
MGFFESQEKILALADNHCPCTAGSADNCRPEFGDKSIYLFFILKHWIRTFIFYPHGFNCKRILIFRK